MDEQCWGVIGIVVDNRHETAVHIQEILTDFGDIIMGRMGVPMRGLHTCVISLIVDGKSEHAKKLAERLRAIPGVEVTEAFTYATTHAGDVTSDKNSRSHETTKV